MFQSGNEAIVDGESAGRAITYAPFLLPQKTFKGFGNCRRGLYGRWFGVVVRIGADDDGIRGLLPICVGFRMEGDEFGSTSRTVGVRCSINATTRIPVKVCCKGHVRSMVYNTKSGHSRHSVSCWTFAMTCPQGASGP